jgi:hypothetical protein
MRYQEVHWLHELADEPVVLFSEVDDDGVERRKVERFRGGRLDLADEVTETGSTMLGEGPMPSLDEINAHPEFEGRPIAKEEFEAVWRRAWEWFEDDDSPAR